MLFQTRVWDHASTETYIFGAGNKMIIKRQRFHYNLLRFQADASVSGGRVVGQTRGSRVRVKLVPLHLGGQLRHRQRARWPQRGAAGKLSQRVPLAECLRGGGGDVYPNPFCKPQLCSLHFHLTRSLCYPRMCPRLSPKLTVHKQCVYKQRTNSVCKNTYFLSLVRRCRSPPSLPRTHGASPRVPSPRQGVSC